MAQNPVLGKLQGQGLFETTTAGIEQAGGALAVTPVGAAMQGRGPDSQKMAGTQPAKINALRAGLQDVQSQALGELRERGAGELTAEQQARAATAKSATVLGMVDDRIAKRVEARTKSSLLGLKITGAEIDTEKLPGYDNIKLTELRKSISDLITGTDLTDSDIAAINAAIKAADPQGTILEFDPAKLPSAPVMAASLSSLFKNKTTDELTSEIGNAISSAKDSSTIGALDNEDAVAILGEGKTKDDLVTLIASVTGKDAAAISGMQLAEVRAAIQNWKDTEFKDVAKLRQDLNSPMTSPARRQLALTELRRLGQLELTAAEAKVGNLEQQMKEGDEVRIGTEVFTVEELFKDPAKLLQLQTWADNPETAPPELKAFLTANAGAIQSKVTEIIGAGDTGLTGAIDTVKTNAETFKLDDSVADIPSDLIDKYFPGWGSIGLDDKKSTVTQADIDAMPATTEAERAAKAAKQADLDKTLKYSLLQNPATAQSMRLLMGNLGTIPGVKGTDVFNKLTYAQMQLLASDENRVNDFVVSLKNQNSIKNFKGDPATLSSEFRFLTDSLGIGPTGKQLSNLVGKNLAAYKDIFTRAGLGGLLNADGTFNFNAIQTELNGLRDADYATLINGKARSVKDSLVNKMDVLFREISKAPQRYEQFPDTPQKAELKFAEDKGIKNPKVILAEKETLRNQLGGENHQNWLDYESKKAGKAYPTEAQFFRNTPPEFRDSAVYFDTFREQIMADSAAERKWKDSTNRFNAANADWNNYQNNYTKEVTNYQDAYDAWAADYRSTLNTKNKDLQKTYDDLEDLLRGAA